MDVFGALLGLSIALQAVAFGLLCAALPVLYVWMLVDAILRDEREYPGGGANEKLVWILLMIFLNFTAVLYFFMVFCKIKRGTRPAAPTGYTAAAPVAPAA